MKPTFGAPKGRKQEYQVNKKDFQNTNNRLSSPVSGGGGEPAGYDDNVIDSQSSMTCTLQIGDTLTFNFQKAVK